MNSRIRVPIKIRIAGTWFPIKYRMVVPCPNGDADEVCGYTETDLNPHISISKSQHSSFDGLMSTLLHECIHAAIRITGHLATVGERNEERLVIALEHALKHTLVFKSDSNSADIKWAVRTFPFAG